MIELPKVDAYRINAFEHQHGEHGAPSLDVIATEHYGREYCAQQTGDKLSDGSWTEYPMDKYDVEQALFDGLTIVKGEHYNDKPTYLSGREGIENWLAMDRSEEHGAQLKAVRAAPTPTIILADLIDKGLLPHGTYLMYCYW